MSDQSRTLWENIAYTKPDATQERILKAAGGLYAQLWRRQGQCVYTAMDRSIS